MNLSIRLLGCEVLGISTDQERHDDETDPGSATAMPLDAGTASTWRGHLTPALDYPEDGSKT